MAKDIRLTVRLNVDGKDMVAQATTSVSQLQRALDQTRASSERLNKSWINANQFIQLSNNLTSSISQIAGTLNSVTAESRTFGGAMREANTMAGKGAEGFKQMKAQVTELSKEIPIARDALAHGLYQVISNGVPEDNWLGFLEQSAKASVGGLADLEEVVKVTSTVIKNYGLEWSAAGDVQDKIQLTAKNGVTSFAQLAEALPSVAGQASQLGVSFSEMLAVMSTLTGVTGNTSEVSTQLGSVLTALTKETEKSQEMAHAMGIEFNAASIKSAGGLKNFLTELDKTVTAYSNKTGMLKESIYSKLFGRAEALRLVNALTGQLAQKYDENMTQLDNSAGEINRAYGEMGSTGGAALQKLKNSWGELTDVFTTAVSAFMPALNILSQVGMAVTGVMGLTKAITSLHLVQKLASMSSMRLVLASALLGPGTRRSAAAVHVLANAHRSAATSAIAAKVAIRGLLAASGVGLVLMGLSFVIEKLVESFSGASDSADKFAESADGVKEHAESVKSAYQSTLSSTYSDLMSKYEKLRQGWKALRTEHEKTEWIKTNQAAMSDLKLEVGGINDAENIFNGNTNAVVAAFTARAKAAARMAQLTELYRQQMEVTDKLATKKQEIKARGQKRLRDVRASRNVISPAYGTATSFGMAVTYDRKQPTDKEVMAYNANEAKNDPALKQLQAAGAAIAKQIVQVSKMVAEETKAAAPKLQRPKVHTPAKVHTGRSHTGTSGTKPLRLNPTASTLDQIQGNLDYYEAKLKKVSLVEAAEVNKQIAFWQEKADAIRDAGKAVESGPQLNGNAGTLKDIQGNLDYYNTQLQTASIAEAAAINQAIELWEKKAEAIRNAGKAEAVESGPQLIGNAGTLKDIQGNIDYYNAQLQTASITEAAAINQAIELWEKKAEAIRNAGKEAEKASGLSGFAEAAGSIGALAGNMKQLVGESQGMAAAMTGVSIAASIAQIVAQMVEKASKSITIWDWIAGITAGTATVVSAASQLKGVGAFAKGGVVSGPTLALVGEYAGASNNPEVIAPLDKLRSMIEPGGGIGNVQFKIQGRDLVGTIANETRIGAKSGRKSNIR